MDEIMASWGTDWQCRTAATSHSQLQVAADATPNIVAKMRKTSPFPALLGFLSFVLLHSFPSRIYTPVVCFVPSILFLV
jgi:hypothetical protein